MKINRIKSKSGKIRKYSDNIFMNIYYFLCFYSYIFLISIGIALFWIVALFLVDFLAHDTLAKIDEKTSLHLFDQLKSSHRYQEAIYLMEYKEEMLDNSTNVWQYNMELTDCYIHVGDFSEAERRLLNMYNNGISLIQNEEVREKLLAADKRMTSVLEFSVARSLFQLYEKMGDKKNHTLFFHKMKQHYKDASSFIMSDTIQNAIKDMIPFYAPNVNYSFDPTKLLEYDEICVQYYTDRDKAIKSLIYYVESIYDDATIGLSYKIKVLNRLIAWLIDNNRTITSYKYIAVAVDLAKQLKIVEEFSVVGELSDYCYLAGDIETSQKLFRLYQQYLDETYNEQDLDYLTNHVRSFRYLENEGKWDLLTENLIKCCEGMRMQITKNLSSMSEEQREYFAKMLDVPFEYAEDLLERRPSPEMANLCFDNVAFKSGLLLRSNLTLKNIIKRTDNASLISKYDSLVHLQRELIFESVSQKTFNYFTKTKLSQEVERLEKEVAMMSTDFKKRAAFSERNWKDVQDELEDDQAIVELIESNNSCYALILKAEGNVEYVHISSKNELLPKLNNKIDEFYHDANVTKQIWGEISAYLTECSKIYYFPVGLFNNISLATLYWGDNKYLCDNYDIELISNPAEVEKDMQESFLAKNDSFVSLWGGIDYGTSMDNIEAHVEIHRAITRGDSLKYLPYAYDEVVKVAEYLNNQNIKNKIYTKGDATEQSFKARDGKNDIILHISSHGFFNDAAMEENKRSPMYNCGLFFAGSNKYWINDSVPLIPGLEDGILRAAEISTLDFTNSELVVLSACETGLGYNDTSEGVYGLQRAFKLAGAKKILMSLWKVGDEPTSMLMQEFYKSLLEGNNPNKALDIAKRKVRTVYLSPKDWGGFVLLN